MSAKGEDKVLAPKKAGNERETTAWRQAQIRLYGRTLGKNFQGNGCALSRPLLVVNETHHAVIAGLANIAR